jgi:type IV pilus assembly protein PilM
MARYITGLDIGSDYAKIVQFNHHRNSINLTHCGKVVIDSSTIQGETEGEIDEKRETLLLDSLKNYTRSNKLKISALYISIPKRFATIRAIVLPYSKPDEIPQMLYFEAQKHIPFQIEEHIIDYHVISSDQMEGVKVILVSVRREVVQKHYDFVRKLGYEPAGIGVSSLAIFNSHNFLSGKIDEPAALLNLGMEYSDFLIIESRELRFARSAPVGISTFLDPVKKELNKDNGDLTRIIDDIDFNTELDDNGEKQLVHKAVTEWLDKTVNETKRSMTYYQAEEDSANVENLYVMGAAMGYRNVDQYLQGALDFNIIKPAISNNLSFASPEIQDTFQRGGYELCLGIAMQNDYPGSLSVNLIPPAEAKKMERRKRVSSLAGTAIMALLLIVFLFMSIFSAFSKRIEYIDSLEKRYTEVEPQTTQLEDWDEKVRILKQEILSKDACLAVLSELSRVFPDTSSIHDLQYSHENALVIGGNAKDSTDISEITNNLNKSSYFTKTVMVISKASTLNDVGDTPFEFHKFRIKTEIVPNE